MARGEAVPHHSDKSVLIISPAPPRLVREKAVRRCSAEFSPVVTQASPRMVRKKTGPRSGSYAPQAPPRFGNMKVVHCPAQISEVGLADPLSPLQLEKFITRPFPSQYG